jgi:hypothetical protein
MLQSFPAAAKRRKRRTEPDLDLINQVEQVVTLRLEGPARRFARILEYGILVLPICQRLVSLIFRCKKQREQLVSCLQNAVTKLREEREAQTPTVPNILKPSPIRWGGLGGGDVHQIAARDPRVSEIWSIREQTACWDRMSFFAAPLQRHRHPHPNPPPSRGRAAASAACYGN